LGSFKGSKAFDSYGLESVEEWLGFGVKFTYFWGEFDKHLYTWGFLESKAYWGVYK
jgi:hypothetical protein